MTERSSSLPLPFLCFFFHHSKAKMENLFAFIIVIKSLKAFLKDVIQMCILVWLETLYGHLCFKVLRLILNDLILANEPIPCLCK